MLLSEENLNSDCQQFHQYQQIQQSLLTSSHWTLKKTTTISDGDNPGPGLDQTQTFD